ncbi:MAG: hypothetical protein Q9220_002721 [cf. Caloplaca sp. 1 TL-2023]
MDSEYDDQPLSDHTLNELEEYMAANPRDDAGSSRDYAGDDGGLPSFYNPPLPTMDDAESPSGTLSSQDHSFGVDPPSVHPSPISFPRKRRHEELEIPTRSTGTVAKSRRTTPSPSSTGDSTPASSASFDVLQHPHFLELLAGNSNEDTANIVTEQEAQEREYRLRKEQERLDAEFAKELAAQFDHSEAMRSVNPQPRTSQSFLDYGGGIRRAEPSTKPSSSSNSSPWPPWTNPSYQPNVPTSSGKLSTHKTAGSSSHQNQNQDNFIILSSDDDEEEEMELAHQNGHGGPVHSSASQNAQNLNSFNPQTHGIVPANNFNTLPFANYAGRANGFTQNQSTSIHGAGGGTNVYGNPTRTGFAGSNSSAFGNAIGGIGQTMTNAANGLWTSAYNLLGRQDPRSLPGGGMYPETAINLLSSPPIIDLDTYNPQQSMLDQYRQRAIGSFPEDPELHDRYMERVDYITNDPTRTAAEIKDLLDNIRPDEELPPENREGTPDAMVYPLMEHQKLGLTWMKSMEEGTNKGGILADGMGLGKTIQALALMVNRRSSDPHRKTTLVIAPVALLKQWEREIRSKLKNIREHTLTTYALHGLGRGASWEELKCFDVVLTTFGTLASEVKRKEKISKARAGNPNWRPLAKTDRLPLLGDECKWYRVIIDEAQCIKNKNTKAALGACQLQALTRFCMSGTPMQNSVNELYSLIRFLRIKPYNEQHRFTADFTKPLRGTYDEEKRRSMQKLQALLKAILLRRDKKSTIDGKPILSLPERTIESQHTEFSQDEQAFYDHLEGKIQLQFNKYLRAGTVGRNYSNVLVLLLRLRQACCHPHLIKDFGIASASAAETASEDLDTMAKQLPPDAIARIIEQGDLNNHSGLECPVCMDATENATIFIPCGHNTCSECFARISDPAQAIANGDDGANNLRCPQCRAKILPAKTTDYNTFKKVHLSYLFAQAEVKEEPEGSSSDTSETEDESASDEGSDLDGFIVDDEDEDTGDEEGYRKGKTPFERCFKLENAGDDGSRSQEGRRKGKGKAKAPDRAPKKTLAQLKKESLRNMKARKKYVARLKKDWEPSAKITRTMDILQNILDGQEGEKTIIFSQFTSLLDLLEVPIYDKGWKYKRYDGSMSADARNEAVLEFTDKPDCKIMLVSLRAGNAGLNLVAASQVIIMDPFWNPYVEEQAIDRAHRIGQNRPVQVHRILVPGTVEDRILALQEKKRAMIESALDENASKEVGRLGVRELGYLFSVLKVMAAPGAKRGASAANLQPPKYRRRQRVINSCFECRKRKMRCSKTYPCHNCSKHSRKCVFVAFQDPDVRASMASGAAPRSERSTSHSIVSDEDDDTRLYFPQPASSNQASSGSGQTPEPDSQVIIGGLFRPGFGELLDSLLVQTGQSIPERPFDGQNASVNTTSQTIQPPISLEPSFDLLLPLSSMPSGVTVDSILSRSELDMLYHQYFKAVHPLAHVVHKPTFDRQFYRSFLTQDPSKGATKSFTALVLAMCFAAAVSLSFTQPQVQFQTTKMALVDKLKAAAERALVAAQHMKSLKLETMQAFTIYLVPQCCGQISRTQSSLVGALIRLAQCAGLQRDASASDISPLECHIRGLLWYQICFLDLHTCEAQGPMPMIHDGDFDTPLPLNVNDVAFELSTLPIPSSDWTDVTLTLMRFEITDIQKHIFRERVALTKKETELSTVRATVESRVQSIVDKYLNQLDDSIPIQRCARLTATSLLSRCLPMVLQLFLRFEDRSEFQEEVQNTMLNSSLAMMEASATLETATDLSPWAWYAPTYQQYHSIFMPLILLYLNPNIPQAARASAMIDHVFGSCFGMTRQQRCGDIIRMLADECTAFMKLRKVKSMAVGSSRSSEASPPNIEAAFADYRQGQQPNHQDTASTEPSLDQQSLEELVAGFTDPAVSTAEWWSMPDQMGFVDPLFTFQEGT